MSIPKKVVKNFITKFNVTRVKAKLSPQNAGCRLFPTQTPQNDAESNLRGDQGSEYSNEPGTFSVNIQANADASNSSVRRFAQKNPHQKLFSFPMKKDDPDEEVIEKMMEAAKKNGFL
ncbi:Phosphotransferase enzyme [Microsporum audouinii]|uniref:Uncharacterized protein n=1 Tax=Arthroderma otae (strain ATCC MYA-4605 / CBS 113480) TaxID=554155 RepID=C5FK49_ARTOC|nr:uncharacterized protein MCYG_02890 [Microsporum canis CBS 113480]EEQ30071.1 predicted protein [Microsporum canis CBS 113480]